MAITIDLPQVGESVVEGTISKWLKQPGETVEKYDPLVEVETDKVTMEVPSPVDGVLTRILVEEGTTIPMGTPIAEIEAADGQVVAPEPPQPKETITERVPEQVGTTGYFMKDVKPVGPTGGGVEEALPAPAADAAVPSPAQIKAAPLTSPAPSVERQREETGRHSPAVRRLASEHNVDLSQIKGTGLGGRATRNDVMDFIESRGAASSGLRAHAGAPSPGGVGAEEEAVPLSRIRRVIAENMVRSASEIPHAWSMVEVDVTGLVKRREAAKEAFQQSEGIGLTYLPFVIKVVVESLKEHPMLSSTWGGDKIIVKKRVHIGIAVAAPDGLVVPVIHDPDTLTIAGLAKTAADLTARARDGKLTLPDIQGGTFTLNNTGALGSIVSQPIINHPQAAILTTEAIQKRPVVVGDGIAIRSMMNICLSFDHRIIDGAQAGAFLQSVKLRLEAIGPDSPIN